MFAVLTAAGEYFSVITLKKIKHLPDSLCYVIGSVTRQGVVKVSDEVISVVFRQGHEGSSHHDEFHFIHAVAQLLQL